MEYSFCITERAQRNCCEINIRVGPGGVHSGVSTVEKFANNRISRPEAWQLVQGKLTVS